MISGGGGFGGGMGELVSRDPVLALFMLVVMALVGWWLINR